MKMKCVSLSFAAVKGWKQSTVDKDSSDTLAQSNDCERNRCNVTLKLFNNDCTKAISNLYTHTRDELKRLSFPSGFESEYIVPTSTYEQVRKLLADSKDKLAVLLQDLESHWSEYIANEAKLGNFFDASKYPKVESIIAGTSITTKFSPMKYENQYAGLFDNSDQEEELQRQHEEDMNGILERAEKELLSRILVACNKTIGILERYHDGGKRIATDDVLVALVTRIEDVVALNYLGSAEVADQLTQVQLVLRSADHVQFKNKQYAEKFVQELRIATKQSNAEVVVVKPIVSVVPKEEVVVVKSNTPIMRRINLSDLD